MADSGTGRLTAIPSQELNELTQALPDSITSIQLVEDDLFRWDIRLSAPSDSAYDGGKFTLLLSLPQDYPFKPPSLRFMTPIYHPNVTNDGADPLGLKQTSRPINPNAPLSSRPPPPPVSRYAAARAMAGRAGGGGATPGSSAAASLAGAAGGGADGNLPPGSMCLAMLKQDNWKPANRLRGVLESAGNILREPNTDDAVEGDIAELYGRDRKEFDKRVEGWVKKYAMK